MNSGNGAWPWRGLGNNRGHRWVGTLVVTLWLLASVPSGVLRPAGGPVLAGKGRNAWQCILWVLSGKWMSLSSKDRAAVDSAPEAGQSPVVSAPIEEPKPPSAQAFPPTSLKGRFPETSEAPTLADLRDGELDKLFGLVPPALLDGNQQRSVVARLVAGSQRERKRWMTFLRAPFLYDLDEATEVLAERLAGSEASGAAAIAAPQPLWERSLLTVEEFDRELALVEALRILTHLKLREEGTSKASDAMRLVAAGVVLRSNHDEADRAFFDALADSGAGFSFVLADFLKHEEPEPLFFRLLARASSRSAEHRPNPRHVQALGREAVDKLTRAGLSYGDDPSFKERLLKTALAVCVRLAEYFQSVDEAERGRHFVISGLVIAGALDAQDGEIQFPVPPE